MFYDEITLYSDHTLHCIIRYPKDSEILKITKISRFKPIISDYILKNKNNILNILIQAEERKRMIGWIHSIVSAPHLKTLKMLVESGISPVEHFGNVIKHLYYTLAFFSDIEKHLWDSKPYDEKPEEAYLHEIINEMVTIYKSYVYRIHESMPQFDIRNEIGEQPVRVYKELIEEAVFTILDNSFKYGPNNNKICIHIRKNGDFILLTFKDINEHPHNFKSIKKGKGLSFVEFVCKKHGGEMILHERPRDYHENMCTPKITMKIREV